MLGVLYLILCSFTGFVLIKRLLPSVFNMNEFESLYGKPSGVTRWMATIPSSFLAGTIVITWFVYLMAYIFRNTDNALLYGNITALPVFAAAVFYYILMRKKGSDIQNRTGISIPARVWFFLSKSRIELLYLIIMTLITCFFMLRSLYMKDGVLFTGFSVYSDFGPHLSMIRSFAVGSNFPTGYPHYADGTIRYHFMFQFLSGNLEFLGLRLDWAFNLPSILSMLSFLSLLYVLAVVLTGQKWAGFIAGVMFYFRSSMAFFTYMADQGWNKSAVEKLVKGTGYIGRTSHEDWGLWSQKDYINQRHLAFGFAVLIMVILIMYPLFRKMVSSLALLKQKTQNSKNCDKSTAKRAKPAGMHEAVKTRFIIWFKEYALCRDAWIPESYVRPVVTGLLLGAISFWHGSMLIATLLILFVIALLSKHRMEHAIVASLTIILTLAQSKFFAGSGSSIVSPQIAVGFLASKNDLAGIISYYIELLGLMPVVLAAGVIFAPKGMRWLALAFITPLVFATTITLVPDVSINHKYVAASVILLNIIAANFLYRAFKAKGSVPRIAAAVLFAALTVTGVANAFTLYNMDKNHTTFAMNNPVMLWTEKNTDKDSVFLTNNYVTHPILMAGRKIFNGYQYYAGSAGYDTAKRDRITSEIYGAVSGEKMKQLAVANGIDYIVVDNSNRSSTMYKLNEKVIQNEFKMVYHNPQYDDIKIFEVN